MTPETFATLVDRINDLPNVTATIDRVFMTEEPYSATIDIGTHDEYEIDNITVSRDGTLKIRQMPVVVTPELIHRIISIFDLVQEALEVDR